MTTQNIEELRKLAEAATPGPWIVSDPTETMHAVRTAAGRIIADVGYSGTIERDQINGDYIAAANPAKVIELLDELQSQAERIKSMQQNMENIYAENKSLRAQLAALQSDDDLPEPFAYALETTNYGLDAEQWDAVEFRKDKWDEDCWPLFRVDQVRQAQSMARSKMVPLEKDAARYRWLREADPDEGPSVMESRMNDWGRWFNSHLWQSELDTAIDDAMGITGEPK